MRGGRSARAVRNPSESIGITRSAARSSNDDGDVQRSPGWTARAGRDCPMSRRGANEEGGRGVVIVVQVEGPRAPQGEPTGRNWGTTRTTGVTSGEQRCGRRGGEYVGWILPVGRNRELRFVLSFVGLILPSTHRLVYVSIVSRHCRNKAIWATADDEKDESSRKRRPVAGAATAAGIRQGGGRTGR